MKRLGAFALLMLLGGCAAQTSVQRIGVGYNNAVANLTDQLALLNVVRAERGYPLHYTSLSRLSGSITLKMTGSVNGQIKDAAPTDTTSTVTTDAPTGETIVKTLTHAVTSGGNQYMPSLGGEVDTNPSFDVDVNDAQDFYRGITAGIDASTIDNLIRQGYDQRDLLALTISDVAFTLTSDSKVLNQKAKETALYLSNRRGDADVPAAEKAAPTQDQLKSLFSCYNFEMVDKKDDGKALAPLSAVAGSNPNASRHLTLQDLALLDGTKLDLSESLNGNTAHDDKVTIVRPSTKKSVGKFTWDDNRRPRTCDFVAFRGKAEDGTDVTVYQPQNPPAQRIFVGSGMMLVGSTNPAGTPLVIYVPVEISMTIRSPEAVIQFVGDCLGAFGPAESVRTCRVGGRTLFELHHGRGGAHDVSAEFQGERYYIDPASDGGRASLKTIGLVEKLIDLNKSATDKPVTTPVHVVS